MRIYKISQSNVLYEQVMKFLEGVYAKKPRSPEQIKNEALDLVSEINLMYGGSFSAWRAFEEEVKRFSP